MILHHAKGILISISIVALCFSCSKEKEPMQTISELNADDIAYLLGAIKEIGQKDQYYRNMISLGTTDQAILEQDRENRKTMTIEEYFAFKDSLGLTGLDQAAKDSLWRLQHALDEENHKQFKLIVAQYGYPSPERLGVDKDKLFKILLHPPVSTTPEEYLEDMVAILEPEVFAGRMDATSFAMFYDNIMHKVLKRPQLYGVVKIFDPITRSEQNPVINNIDSTNAARERIGLEALQAGEYEHVSNSD